MARLSTRYPISMTLYNCQLGSSCDGCEFVVSHVHCLTEAGGITGVELRWLAIGSVEQGQWLQIRERLALPFLAMSARRRTPSRR